MNVSDFKFSADSRFGKLEALLGQLYGIKIDWDQPESYLESVLQNYEDRKKLVITEGIVAMTSPEYGKAVLIAEAIRTYLREIAPNRRKKNRRTE